MPVYWENQQIFQSIIKKNKIKKKINKFYIPNLYKINYIRHYQEKITSTLSHTEWILTLSTVLPVTAEATRYCANGIQREIKVIGQKLGIVTSFRYFGAVVSLNGSNTKVGSRIAHATAALTKWKLICRDNNISGVRSKVKLMHSLVISIFSSPKHKVLMVSCCDLSLSIVHALSTFCFKWLFLQNG